MRQFKCFYIAGAAAVMPLLAFQLLPITYAWPVSDSYSAAFKAINALYLGAMLWDALVIFGCAFGLLALLVLFVLCSLGVVRTALDVVVFVFAGILAMRLAPAYFGAPVIWPNAWWDLGPELTFVLVGAGGVISLWLWPNNSFKPSPLRGPA